MALFIFVSTDPNWNSIAHIKMHFQKTSKGFACILSPEKDKLLKYV